MSILTVVADSGKARILRAEDRLSSLQEIKDLVFPDARLREQDLVSDGVGAGNGGGSGSHSMGHEKGAHQHQAELFARELCQNLEQTVQSDHIHRIYVMAAPRFLGLIRANLSKTCAGMVAAELDKNLVNQSIDAIRSHLPKVL